MVYLEQESIFKSKIYSTDQVGSLLKDIIIRIEAGEVINVDDELNGGSEEKAEQP